MLKFIAETGELLPVTRKKQAQIALDSPSLTSISSEASMKIQNPFADATDQIHTEKTLSDSFTTPIVHDHTR